LSGSEEPSRFGRGVLPFIETLGKPGIAAINGFALGGGCETAMACTMRIAAENAKFARPEVQLRPRRGRGRRRGWTRARPRGLRSKRLISASARQQKTRRKAPLPSSKNARRSFTDGE